jgi:hypothetical protein
MYTEIRTLLKLCSQNWGVSQIFLQLFKISFLYVSYYLSVNISDALGTMLEDYISSKPPRIQSPNSLSVAKGATGRNLFKRFMKRHGDKLVCQPTGTSTAITAGFSREQAGIFFDCKEKRFLHMTIQSHVF